MAEGEDMMDWADQVERDLTTQDKKDGDRIDAIEKLTDKYTEEWYKEAMSDYVIMSDWVANNAQEGFEEFFVAISTMNDSLAPDFFRGCLKDVIRRDARKAAIKEVDNGKH